MTCSSRKGSLAIREKMTPSAPRQKDLAVSHERIGDVLLAQGQPTAALTSFRNALAAREKLAAAAPSNELVQKELAIVRARVAKALAAQPKK